MAPEDRLEFNTMIMTMSLSKKDSHITRIIKVRVRPPEVNQTDGTDQCQGHA